MSYLAPVSITPSARDVWTAMTARIRCETEAAAATLTATTGGYALGTYLCGYGPLHTLITAAAFSLATGATSRYISSAAADDPLKHCYLPNSVLVYRGRDERQALRDSVIISGAALAAKTIASVLGWEVPVSGYHVTLSMIHFYAKTAENGLVQKQLLLANTLDDATQVEGSVDSSDDDTQEGLESVGSSDDDAPQEEGVK